MTDPQWLAELVGVHSVLAAEDQRLARDWGPDGPPPMTMRLGALAHAFVEHAVDFDPDQRAEMFDLLERVLASGSEVDGAAAATGFFEALLNDYDRGFDLGSVWPYIGPQSRAHCQAWNAFTGVPTPSWMT